MARIRVFFATNRNYQPENKLVVFGKHFNPDGVAALRFGYADYDRGAKGPTLAGVTVYDDKKGPSDNKPGSQNLLTDLHQAMAGQRTDTLVFIHGFNVGFVDALAAAARIADEVKVGGRDLNLVVFSWPSDGEKVPWMSYYSDREDARASGPALARAYLMLQDFVSKLGEEEHCQRCLHLLAHSMGAYMLRNGLQAILAKDPNKLTRLFDQILLAAPDEDDDTFETDQKLRLLPRLGRRVTVYFNRNDRALIVSDKTKSNPDRLGSDGPRLIDLIPKKVALVDCRNVAMSADKVVGHSYYINSPAMAADIAAVLLDTDSEAIPNREYIPAKRVWRIIQDLSLAA
ncbi:MAG TPA: alpha/beta fold hydrolase [Phenylobacterium sp.]